MVNGKNTFWNFEVFFPPTHTPMLARWITFSRVKIDLFFHRQSMIADFQFKQLWIICSKETAKKKDKHLQEITIMCLTLYLLQEPSFTYDWLMPRNDCKKKNTRKKTKIPTLKSSQQLMKRFASDSIDLRKEKNNKNMVLTELTAVWKQTKLVQPERMLKQWPEAMKSRNAVLYPY